MSLAELLQLASSRFGLIRLSDAARFGISRQRLDRMVAGETLDFLGHGVYRVAGSPATWHQSVLAGVWRTGPEALASHRTAAALRDATMVRRSVIEVLVPRGRGARVPGVKLHETRRLADEDRGAVGPIPATSPQRTVIDMAWLGPVHRTESVLDDFVHRGHSTDDEVADHLDSMPTRGRRGAASLRVILSDRIGDPDARENAFENRMSRLLASGDLPAAVRQHKVKVAGATYYLDFAFPDHLVAVECDSVGSHSTGPQFRNDLDRQQACEEKGWRFRRFLPSHLRDSPEAVLRGIRTLLMEQGWRP